MNEMLTPFDILKAWRSGMDQLVDKLYAIIDGLNADVARLERELAAAEEAATSPTPPATKIQWTREEALKWADNAEVGDTFFAADIDGWRVPDWMTQARNKWGFKKHYKTIRVVERIDGVTYEGSRAWRVS